jgi:hypothetical protein
MNSSGMLSSWCGRIARRIPFESINSFSPTFLGSAKTNTVEDTVNNLLADYLRSKKFNILAQVSARVQAGRRQPDFEMAGEEGVYYGEGEWSLNYAKGFIQAIEFGDIPGCSGYFLIGYPEELKSSIRRARISTTDPSKLLASRTYRGMFKVEGRRPTLFEGSLEGIPEWIRRTLERTEQPEQPDAFISLMGDIVTELTNYLPESGAYPSFFEHIVASMPKDKGELETAKKAAAYLLLNQIVFYRILSAGRGYPRIDRTAIHAPGDLTAKYFSLVLKDDYQAVFSFDVASLFPKQALQFMIDMIRIIEHIEPETFTRDLLGNIFHRLIPEEVRKPVAAYYTNPMAARLLARLAVKRPRDKVADFACGSGTLLMASYEAKANLLGRGFREEDHKAFIEKDLTGIDIMPFAAHLAVIQLALKNPVYWTESVRVAVHDSTDIHPGDHVASLQMIIPQQTRFRITSSGELEVERPEGSRKGAISPSGSGKGFQLEKEDIVIMNPPFSKKQFINQNFRDTLVGRFPDYRSYTTNEQSYWAYFVLLADRFLKPEGRMALVLPASVLRQPSNLGIRRLLMKNYDIRYVITTEYRAAFSESASFREILLIAIKSQDHKRPAMFCTLSVLPNTQNVDLLFDSLSKAEKIGNDNPLHSFGRAKFYSQDELARASDWFSFLPGEEQRLPELEEAGNLHRLDSVVPDIIQGLRLNKQELEMRPENTMLSYEREERTMIDWKITKEDMKYVWALSKARAIELRFPRSALAASTRTATGMDKILVDRRFDYVVVDRFKNDDEFWNGAPADEILLARRKQIATRSAYLLVAGRGGLNLAADGTKLLAFCTREKIAPTWAFWSFRTKTFEEAQILSLWWNSTFSLNQLIDKRTEVEGSRVWFGKEAINPLPVLDPKKLDEAQKGAMLSLFKSLSGVSFPSILHQLETNFESRTKIDEVTADIARIPGYDSRKSIIDLHRATAEKLEALRSMMGRK